MRRGSERCYPNLNYINILILTECCANQMATPESIGYLVYDPRRRPQPGFFMCYSILVQQDLKVLNERFGASPVRTQFEHYARMSTLDPNQFKPLTQHPRIYPNYFAPVIIARQGKRWSLPMRYRIRPQGSSAEVPTKYNLFNARLDSLTTRSTWRKLFMRHHGILVFREFYEWVVDPVTKKKKVVAFRPDNSDLMWAPALYDWWESEDHTQSYFSFAIITRPPPPEVLAAGHDRCPLFLHESEWERWLHPDSLDEHDTMQLLSHLQPVHFNVVAATP